ncbi:MAG TPA: DUF211 domain-containing protein [Pseudomonadales bacterium]
MTAIRRLVLDVLKPHQPNAVEFATKLAEAASDYKVKLTVATVDEKTETVELTITGQEINFAGITSVIEQMGASVHSIDEVEVDGSGTLI